MRSDEALAIYQKLSTQYQTDRWTEPINLPEHLARLEELLDSDIDYYPEPFRFERQNIPAYIEHWSAFARNLEHANLTAAIKQRVLADVREDLERASVLAQEDDDAYTQVQRDQVGLPSEELAATAWEILKGDLRKVPFPVPSEPPAQENVAAAEIQSRMAAALAAYDLDDWYAVVEPNMTAQASVNGSLRRVRVRANAMFTERSANRLLAHEIGGHVLRWANSRCQPEQWTSVALGQTVPTEEGMAAWREVEFGLQNQKQLRIYAARVVAVDAAQRIGLIDIARLIYPYVGARSAAEIAIRTKRGLLNPNSPGGPTKDWGYLAGLLQMAELAYTNPDALRLLASVKWPLQDLELIEELHAEGRVLLPERLPEKDLLGLRAA